MVHLSSCVCMPRNIDLLKHQRETKETRSQDSGGKWIFISKSFLLRSWFNNWGPNSVDFMQVLGPKLFIGHKQTASWLQRISCRIFSHYDIYSLQKIKNRRLIILNTDLHAWRTNSQVATYLEHSDWWNLFRVQSYEEKKECQTHASFLSVILAHFIQNDTDIALEYDLTSRRIYHQKIWCIRPQGTPCNAYSPRHFPFNISQT